MGRKTDKVCKEWEREQNMQIVVFEKISSDEPKKTTEANEGVFKSIETEMRNSRKKSRAKKRNLPRMIAAKKFSTPQIPSNSEGRNNLEESDDLESSFEPYTEREEEKCEEEDEYISTEVGMEVEDPSSEVMETDGLESFYISPPFFIFSLFIVVYSLWMARVKSIAQIPKHIVSSDVTFVPTVKVLCSITNYFVRNRIEIFHLRIA